MDEKPTHSSAEFDNSVPSQSDTPAKPALYDIQPSAEGFTVTLPGLLDADKGYTVGTQIRTYPTREAAEQAITQSRKRIQIAVEEASIRKAFPSSFYRLTQTPDGLFRVTTPALHNLQNNDAIGTTYRDFATWDEAKAYFLQARSKESVNHLTDHPILELNLSPNQRLAFSRLEDFNPQVEPTQESIEIPPSIQEYLHEGGRDGSHPSAKTYQVTIQEKFWQSNLVGFIDSYLQQQGSGLAKELDLTGLDTLTPKQAIDLTTRLVIALTKYKTTDTHQGQPNHLHGNTSNADQSTALQLLRQGLFKRNDPNWEGNGVCRNFASLTKAIFEALKSQQTAFSRLNSTFCTYEGDDHTFDPKRADPTTLQLDQTGHAWNTFITASETGEANAVIVDATWAQQDLETGQVIGLDQTTLRMEPIVFKAGQTLNNSPDQEGQLPAILRYYDQRISHPEPLEPAAPLSGYSPEQQTRLANIARQIYSQTPNLSHISDSELALMGLDYLVQQNAKQVQDQQRRFFVTRALALIGSASDRIPAGLPPTLCLAISQEYTKMAGDIDVSELQNLYALYQNYPSVNFPAILRQYLQNKELSEYNANRLIVPDNDLQRLIARQLQERPNFSQSLQQSPSFRRRLRQCLPEIFGNFSPESNPGDFAELQSAIRQSPYLQRFSYLLGSQPAPEKINRFFATIRQSLLQRHPDLQSNLDQLDNYQLLQQYDKLTRQSHPR